MHVLPSLLFFCALLSPIAPFSPTMLRSPLLRRTLPSPSSITRLFSSLNDQISAKGDEIRELKEAGRDNSSLQPHIAELLALKAQLSPPPTPTQSTTTQSTPTPKGSKPPPPFDLREVRTSRLSKIAAMRAANTNPYPHTFTPTHTAKQLQELYPPDKLAAGENSGLIVTVAGRVFAKRVFGKLTFFQFQDATGPIQLQFERDVLQADGGVDYQNLKAWTDAGDVVGVRGEVRRTDKGELTVS